MTPSRAQTTENQKHRTPSVTPHELGRRRDMSTHRPRAPAIRAPGAVAARTLSPDDRFQPDRKAVHGGPTRGTTPSHSQAPSDTSITAAPPREHPRLRTRLPRPASIGARSTPARAVSPPRGPWTPPRVLSILPADWPTSSVVGRCCYATPTGPQAHGATEPFHTLLHRLAVQRAPRRGATLPALRANGARLGAAPLQHGESRVVTGAALPAHGRMEHGSTVAPCSNGRSRARWRTGARRRRKNDKRSPVASRMTSMSPGRSAGPPPTRTTAPNEGP